MLGESSFAFARETICNAQGAHCYMISRYVFAWHGHSDLREIMSNEEDGMEKKMEEVFLSNSSRKIGRSQVWQSIRSIMENE